MSTKIKIEQLEKLRKNQNDLEWDSGAGWVRLNGAASSEEQNYLQDASAHTTANVENWLKYKEADSVKPVSGQGGSDLAITWEQNTDTPISGAGDFLLSKDGTNCQGQGVSYDFQIQPRHNARILQISVDYKIHSGNYQTGDLTCYIIDPTSTEVIEPSTVTFEAIDGRLTGRLLATFQTHVENLDYRLCFHIATNTTDSWALRFNNIRVWEPEQSVGAIVTDWQDYTPSNELSSVIGSLSRQISKFRRVGSNIEIRYEFASNGTDGTTAFPPSTFLPPGLSISTEHYSLMDYDRKKIGEIYEGSAQGLVGYIYFSRKDPSNELDIDKFNFVGGYNSSGANFEYWGNFSDVGRYSLMMSFPIQGWGSTVTTVQGDSQRTVVARYTHPQATSSNAPINFNNKIIDTHNAVTTGANWKFGAPVSGEYLVNTIFADGTLSNANGRSLMVYRNGSNTDVIIGVFDNITVKNGMTIVSLDAGDSLDLRFLDINIYGANSIEQGINIVLLNPVQKNITVNETIACRYLTHSATQQSIAHDEGYVRVMFDKKDYDTHNSYDSGTGIWTCPEKGFYKVSSWIEFLTSDNGGSKRAGIWKNNTFVSSGPNFSSGPKLQTEDVIQCNVGDTIEIKVVQSDLGRDAKLTGNPNETVLTIYKI